MSLNFVYQDPELLRRLLRAKDRMDNASHEDWPVLWLARVSHVSEAHFARSFKDAFGIPPHRYLLTRRIERAIALLRDSDLSITDIAFQTGWRSLGTFGRIFRDVTGETPGAMRVRLRTGGHELGHVPACILRAAHRPDLKTAVLEKRRRLADVQVVKLTFARGACLKDPHRLFNASLEGNTRRAIDIPEGEMLDAEAFKSLIQAAVAENQRAGTKKAR